MARRSRKRKSQKAAAAPTLDQALEVIRLFNDKVDRLDGLSFVRWLRTNRLAFSIHLSRSGVSATAEGPDSEATDAFVLTLRFFVQNNEPISIDNMAQLYRTLPLPAERIAAVEESRNNLNAYLDEVSVLELNGQRITHRQAFETFLWGSLAHSQKRREYAEWATHPDVLTVLGNIFIEILAEIFRFLFWLRHHNRGALAQIERERAG